MQKFILALLVCGLLGYVVYQNRVQWKLVSAPAKPAAPAAAAAAAGKPGHPAAPGTAAKTAAAASAPAKPAGKPGEPNPVRAQIQPLLGPLKVTSILLGEPSVVIINKQDFGVGDRLPLAGTSRQVKVAAIDEAGVTLVCENETFHLDAPAAPDLAASRRKL